MTGTHDHEASTSNTAAKLSLGAKKMLPIHKRQDKRASSTPKLQQRWVSTAILKAQGYYQGSTTLWLPKVHQPTLPKRPKIRKRNADTIPSVPPVKPTTYWRPTKLRTSKNTPQPPQHYPTEPKRQMKWVIKSPQPAQMQPKKLKIWLPKRLPLLSSQVDPSHSSIETTTSPSSDIELGSSPPPTTELHCPMTIDL